MGFIFCGSQLEEHPTESKSGERDRLENQAQGIFGVWGCLEETCPQGVMRNWSLKPVQMGSEERRVL